MTERRITINDVRLAGYCTAGARRWFEKHGLDFRAFIVHGIPEDEFLATGCTMAEHIVRAKGERGE